MISNRLQKAINKYIDENIHERGDYYDYLSEIYGDIFLRDIEYKYIVEGVFTYIIQEQNEDPFDHFKENFLEQNFYPSEADTILTNSGWYDKFYTIDRFIKYDNNNISKSVYRDIVVEGEKIYLLCTDWKELSILFPNGDRSWVERVLGEDDADIFGWFDVDFNDDVWDNLDEKSIEHIKEYIRENNFIGKELDFEPDGYDSNILTDEMIEDIDVLRTLLDEEEIFSELRGELENFYRWSYDVAAEDELFSEIREEIESLFESKGEWDYTISKKYNLKFDVTKIFMEINEGFLNCTSKIPDYEYSDFIEVLGEYLNCDDKELTTRNIDYFYPDSSKVGEYFNDYILNNL